MHEISIDKVIKINSRSDDEAFVGALMDHRDFVLGLGQSDDDDDGKLVLKYQNYIHTAR